MIDIRKIFKKQSVEMKAIKPNFTCGRWKMEINEIEFESLTVTVVVNGYSETDHVKFAAPLHQCFGLLLFRKPSSSHQR